MVIAETKYLTSYKDLKKSFSNGKIPNNILLVIKEKILLDDLVNIVCENFIGKDFNAKSDLSIFNAEDRQNENFINECSNTGLFSERKVVVLKNIKKLLKDGKLSLVDYLVRHNPDTCLIMTYTDDDLSSDKLDKIFLTDAKSTGNTQKISKKEIENNIRIYQVSEFSENEIISWVEEKFGDYKINEDTIKYFLQFSNNDLDETLSEIEKLKTYCYLTKEVSMDTVNLCNGIAKEFNEIDFIKAVVEKKSDEAMKIYDYISLKKDSEVYLVFLLSAAFVTINKLSDPGFAKLNGFMLKKELKFWLPGQEMLVPFYKNFRRSLNSDGMSAAFNYIYSADKSLKTSGGDRKTIMSRLINNICKL